VDPRASLAPALAVTLVLAAIPLSGCVGQGDTSEGVVVTSQPLVDAVHVLDRADELAGIPDWAILDDPAEAERVGRPFVIEAEQVVELGPRLVIDQPHPLVSGPSREAMRTGVQQAGIDYRQAPTEANFATIERVLAEAGDATGTDHAAAWSEVRGELAQLNESVPGGEAPDALFLFPAGLVAGAGTDAGLVLELAGLDNAAAEAGLEGYAQITGEAVQRSEVDLVIATATMHKTPSDVAGRPMFEDTPVEDSPERVLVVDPSRTTRLGPHVVEAAASLATWAHEEMPGPRVSPVLDRYQAPACGEVAVAVDAPDATVELLGTEHAPGTVPVPDVEPGHYRVHVTASDDTGTAETWTMLTVEGSQCA